jgi:hypothetical protein
MASGTFGSVLNAVIQTSKPLVIIAEDVEGEAYRGRQRSGKKTNGLDSATRKHFVDC